MGHDAAPLCARGRAVVRGAAGSALEHRGAARLRRRGDVRGAHVAGHPDRGARSTRANVVRAGRPVSRVCTPRGPPSGRGQSPVALGHSSAGVPPLGPGTRVLHRPCPGPIDARRVRPGARAGVRTIRDRLGAAGLIEALGPVAGAPEELSASFLRGGMRQIDSLRDDLSLVGGWRARLAVIGAHLFPSRRYMRSMYPRWPTAALPLTYLDRIVRGAAEMVPPPRRLDARDRSRATPGAIAGPARSGASRGAGRSPSSRTASRGVDGAACGPTRSPSRVSTAPSIRPRNCDSVTAGSSCECMSPLVISTRVSPRRSTRTTRWANSRGPCSKRITSSRSTMIMSTDRTSRTSPGRMSGSMLVPATRIRASPQRRSSSTGDAGPASWRRAEVSSPVVAALISGVLSIVPALLSGRAHLAARERHGLEGALVLECRLHVCLLRAARRWRDRDGAGLTDQLVSRMLLA